MTLFDNHHWLSPAAAFLALSIAALFSNFVVKALLLRLVDVVIEKSPFGRDEVVKDTKIIHRLANVIPALVMSVGVSAIPNLPAGVSAVVTNVSNAVVILVVALTISASLKLIDDLYHRRDDAHLRPIKSYLQVVKIAIFIVAIILMGATVVDKSPVILLSGLGAMAAVLILVFQDTLLSFVASIQINASGMVRVGDWVEMPQMNADGAVIEIALHTVRVQNWDKTITAVPIRKFVTDNFKNWRGMQESGGRRIKRSIYLDQNSIGFLSDADIDRLSGVELLNGYLLDKRQDIADFNKSLDAKAAVPANTRRLTNIGTFRAYVRCYLATHPKLRQDMAQLSRQLQPTAHGLPLEVYCFTDTIVWAEYEMIQADIFDHLYAILPEFGLRTFQAPTGHDVRSVSAIMV
ncbi:mechanosensitive ion channel family protein [Agrobacterium rubi]|nr:mechanosensitive ion channel family protein [Agrobacterium rubi]NTF24702.1 mechanosensitive ion channel family protein [Agrobacterium rubi]